MYSRFTFRNKPKVNFTQITPNSKFYLFLATYVHEFGIGAGPLYIPEQETKKRGKARKFNPISLRIQMENETNKTT